MSEIIKRSTLPNGLVVVSQTLKNFSASGLAITLRGGSGEEKRQEIGLSHLLEHLLFKRTSKLSTFDIASKIDALGGDINACTDTEEISLYGEVPSSNLESMFELFANLLTDCQFSAEEFQIEKDVVKQEISDAKDDPETVVFHRFSEKFWPDSSFGLPVFGYLDTVSELTKELVESRLSELLVGKRIIVSAVGNLEHDDLLQLVNKYFSSLPAGEPPREQAVETGCGFEIVSSQTEQAYLTWGIPWPTLTSSEIYTGQVISSCFGELMSSRLFQELREKRGLAYDVSSSVESYPLTGTLIIQGSFEKERALQALELISLELSKLSSEKLSKGEVDLSKAHILSRLSVEKDSLNAHLWRLQEGETVYNRYLSVEDDMKSISSITLNDVGSFIEKWIKSASSVAVLGGEVEGLKLENYFS